MVKTFKVKAAGTNADALTNQSDNEKVVVTESTMTQTFELLIAIARVKTEEAQQLLTRMAERVGSTGKQSEASKLDLLKEILPKLCLIKR